MADYRVDEHGDRVWMTEAECSRWDAFARQERDQEEMSAKHITPPRLLTKDQLSGARAHLQVNVDRRKL